ncbi:MAG TPA: hypothetical protein VLE95_05820 [Chlamydiales bacterium]|nr:hypothetical protein [Chlamydiales bacterium]
MQNIISNYPINRYEMSWNQVTNPSGHTLVSKVANAAWAAIANIGKFVANVGIFTLNIPNKIYRLFNPVKADAPIEDAIQVQDDINQVDDSGIDLTPVIQYEEELANPAVVPSSWLWRGAKVIGGALTVGALVGTVAHFGKNNSEILKNIDGFYQTTLTAMQTSGKTLACTVGSTLHMQPSFCGTQQV